MKLFKNQKGFNDTIIMTIVGGIIGALFITGVFVWQEINGQKEEARILSAISGMVDHLAESKENKDSEDVAWRVHENFNLGFSLEYPENLTIIDSSDEGANYMDFVNYDVNDPQRKRGLGQDDIDIQVQRHDFSSKFTREDLIDKLKFEGVEYFSQATVKAAAEVELGDYVKYSQYTVSGPSGPMMNYIALDEDSDRYYYILVFEPGYTNNKELIEEIVSSFKFLDEYIDIDDLTYLGYGYYKDGQSVYYRGLENRPIEGKQYEYEQIPVGKIIQMEDVDYDTFISLNKECGMGSCSGVGKDKNNIYVGTMIHPRLSGVNHNADVETFEYLDYNFYRDKDRLYYYGMGWGVADYVDLDTFEFLNHMYMKDKNNVYQFVDGFRILEGEDPDTFELPQY
ncbi:hypothetical protein C0580_04870 [Candidatus Parcubacteria bacterium]|nr:MAG: hypothetical protein C0580_04870 [Candidatus Parcubacteria bacterium]